MIAQLILFGSYGSSAMKIPNSGGQLYSRGVLNWESSEPWHSDTFNDWRGSSNINKSAISYKLKDDITKHKFRFKTFSEDRSNITWIFPSFAPLGFRVKKPKKEYKQYTEEDDKYRKNVRGNITSNFYVNNGDVINFRIKQKLHNVGEDLVNNVHYTNLVLSDELKSQLEYKASAVYLDDERISSNNYSINIDSDNKVSITFKDTYLASLDLQGQTITWKIRAKVQATDSNTITNVSITTFNNSLTVKSNKISLKILPKFNPRIEKTGTEEITDTKQRVNYKIKYTDTIKYYEGKAVVKIVDTLPYKIDESKAYDLDGGTYNSARKTITWEINVRNINSFTNTNNKINITKNINLVFQGFSVNDRAKANTSMRNNVNGITETSTPEASSDRVSDYCDTSFSFNISVKVKKEWEDYGKGRFRRPSPLYLILYENGSPTNKKYTLNPARKDVEEYTFSNLRKYDDNGERIIYEVREISKISGDNKYSLKEIKGDVVGSTDDLRYYIDSTTVSRVEAEDGGTQKVYNIKNTYTSLNIKGNVWKDTNINGKKADEPGFKGVEVQLILETTNNGTKNYSFTGYNVRTDENGDYSFNDIPWNGTYKLRFTYNGQVYETTYYKNNLSGSYSNAKEYSDTRQSFNDKFSSISAYPNNYEGNKRAFGVNQKLRNTSDYNYNFSQDSSILTFENVLNIFDNVNIEIKEYNESFWNTFESTMINTGIEEETASKIKEYMQDCMIIADTPVTYSESNIANLQPGPNNTVENVSVGLSRRAENNLAIINDVYKVTQITNGKMQEDICEAKDEIYEVEGRANSNIYNGSESKTRKLFKSDYLYDGSDIDESSKRNLQVFLTYRIKVKNIGRVSAKINSIATYYDSEYLETIDSISEVPVFKDNTFVGDKNFNKIGNIGIIEDNNNLVEHNYNKIIIAGTEGGDTITPLKVYHESTNAVDDILHPNEELYVFMTYKVKNDTITNRVLIDKEIKNIAEINGYSTVYTPSDNTVIPDRLNNIDRLIKKEINNIVNAGVVDINSDPGNLVKDDLDDNGNIIYKKTKSSITYTNMEDDTDKIGFKLQISQDKNDIRSIGGYVFEDERNYENNILKTSIGNGYMEDSPNEKTINGVTLQLIELIPEIDENGLAVIEKKDGRDSIKYEKELVIGTLNYSSDEQGKLTLDGNYKDAENDSSYYSGKGKAKVIVTGEGQLKVEEEELGNTGTYRFDSIYPGDFYVRFIYGDTVRTTLTNTENEVNELLNTTTYKGLNEKSYNGQDYKSTIYQSAYDRLGNRVEVDQSGSYYAIDGFGYKNGEKDEEKYKTQNFSMNTNVNDQQSMYYYDLQKSNDFIVNNKRVRISDAKDIYDDRIKSTQYSLDLINKNGEVLNSYNKLRSDLSGNKDAKIEQQEEAINELMDKTKMRANTGIIPIEINHNNANTSEVDLGLVERARAQIILNKEVSNIKIVLANGIVLFDNSKSVNNMFFSKHTEHGYKYNANKLVNNPTINEKNGEKTPELIQVYMDSEFMSGSGIQVDYKLRVKNIGEVDYTDSKYYYTGLEDDPENNISKTTIKKVIDYNSNTTKFKDKIQKQDGWKLVSQDLLLDSGLVSKAYKEELKTYNAILVNDNLAGETVPVIFNEEYKTSKPSELSVELVMQADMGYNNLLNSLVYNNISEIVESTNSSGRKNGFSIPGNQELTDQRLLMNAIQGKSKEDRMIPEEIDADSAQKIGILPPTGRNDYMLFLFIFTITLGLLLVGLIIVKAMVLNKKFENTNNK